MAKWVLNNDTLNMHCGACGEEREEGAMSCKCLVPTRMSDEGVRTITARHPNGAKASLLARVIRLF